ncbi:MAG: NAD-binding protein [Candidatus Micrarchaeaceae archaeon]
MAISRTQYTIIAILVVLFVSSFVITIAAGVPPGVAIVDNSLDALQIDYNLISLGAASNPLILISELLDAAILPFLTVVLAAWFFDVIRNINIRERIVLSRIRKLRGHVIVVPYNSFAKYLLGQLRAAGIKSVTITESKNEIGQVYKDGELAIYGDIRSVETFGSAGIDKASYVVACSKEDIQNAIVAITAKTANSDIDIIARANKEENIDRLEKAGARKTVFGESTAGEDMGNEISKRVLTGKPPRKEH